MISNSSQTYSHTFLLPLPIAGNCEFDGEFLLNYIQEMLIIVVVMVTVVAVAILSKIKRLLLVTVVDKFSSYSSIILNSLHLTFTKIFIGILSIHYIAKAETWIPVSINIATNQYGTQG